MGCKASLQYYSYKELGDINTTEEGDPNMTVIQIVNESLQFDEYGEPPFDFVKDLDEANTLVIEYIDDDMQGFWVRDPEQNQMLHYSKQDDYFLLLDLPAYKS